MIFKDFLVEKKTHFLSNPQTNFLKKFASPFSFYLLEKKKNPVHDFFNHFFDLFLFFVWGAHPIRGTF